MTVPVFVDTNLLVYARDAGEPAKQQRAMEVMRVLWAARSGRLSFQVLQEYYVTVTRKLRPGLPTRHARQDVEALLAWQPKPATGETFRVAWSIEDRFRLSWWDSLVVASALEAEARLLLSEDLQDGLVIDTLRVANPFRASFDLDAIRARPKKK